MIKLLNILSEQALNKGASNKKSLQKVTIPYNDSNIEFYGDRYGKGVDNKFTIQNKQDINIPSKYVLSHMPMNFSFPWQNEVTVIDKKLHENEDST